MPEYYKLVKDGTEANLVYDKFNVYQQQGEKWNYMTTILNREDFAELLKRYARQGSDIYRIKTDIFGYRTQQKIQFGDKHILTKRELNRTLEKQARV